MRIRHRGGEDSNLIFRRKVVLHSGVHLGRVGCSQQGICRGDRAHEDAAGSAVDVDEAFTADGGADEGFGGALYGEIKVGGPADGEVSIDFQFVVFEFDFDQFVLRYVAFEGNGASADEAQIEEEMLLRAVSLVLTLPSQARNMPSSIVIPEEPHFSTSTRMMYL